MQSQPEVKTLLLLFFAFWVLIFLLILLFGCFFPKARDFRTAMLAKWKPALVITALYYLSSSLGGNSLVNPYVLAIFSQAIIGLAIAAGIKDFHVLPVADALVQRKKAVNQIVLWIGISVLAVLFTLSIGSIGFGIGHLLFNETILEQQAGSQITGNKLTGFLMILSGGGFVEETTYRLLILSLIWKVTRRKWPAIILSAALFGAYHLTPIDNMYMVFLQYPVSKFFASTLVGIIFGFLYTKRGYETAVLSHTLSDWLPWMLFAGLV